jgi:esterase/lipase superfamily enzyme
MIQGFATYLLADWFQNWPYILPWVVVAFLVVLQWIAIQRLTALEKSLEASLQENKEESGAALQASLSDWRAGQEELLRASTEKMQREVARLVEDGARHSAALLESMQQEIRRQKAEKQSRDKPAENVLHIENFDVPEIKKPISFDFDGLIFENENISSTSPAEPLILSPDGPELPVDIVLEPTQAAESPFVRQGADSDFPVSAPTKEGFILNKPLYVNSGPSSLWNLMAQTYTVEIFYATDRDERKEDDLYYYRDERDPREDLHLGTCSVSIPIDKHKRGRLERPHWWKLQFHENPLRHVVLLDISPLDTDDYFAKVRARIAPDKKDDPKKHAFVFLHGFDVTFEDAARRTAQLAYDLDFEGAPILYSWPSGGTVQLYSADEATIDWTASHLKKFLADLAAKTEATVIHLIAHSMGNRALLAVLNDLSSAGVRQFQQVVLTAPDIDAGKFRQIASAIQSTAQRVTLYASSKDKALLISKGLHRYARAGDAGDDIVVVPGIDTIDATNACTDFLCHSYFSKERTVISDLSYLIRQGLSPAQRSGLEKRFLAESPYWEIAK